jgi:hypothetical protein
MLPVTGPASVVGGGLPESPPPLDVQLVGAVSHLLDAVLHHQPP